MSWRHARWALDLRGLSLSEKALLLVLVIRADDGGKCSQTIVALGQDCCMNQTTVGHAARRLEQRGLISRKKRWGEPTVYRVITTGASMGRQQPPCEQQLVTALARHEPHKRLVPNVSG